MTKAEILSIEPKEFIQRGLATVKSGKMTGEQFGDLMLEYINFRNPGRSKTQKVLDMFPGSEVG